MGKVVAVREKTIRQPPKKKQHLGNFKFELAPQYISHLAIVVNRGLCPKYLKASEISCVWSYASCPPAKSWTSDTFQLSNHHPSLKSEPAAVLVKFHRLRDAVHGKIRYNWGVICKTISDGLRFAAKTDGEICPSPLSHRFRS